MTARAPNMTEKLAATIVAWQRALGAPIPREHVRAMSAAQICSLVEFDHYPIRRVDGGSNDPDNLEPRFRLEHREKTRTIDVPQIRKADRIRKRGRPVRNLRPSDVEFVIDDDKPGVVRSPDPVRDLDLFRRKSRWPQGRKLRSRGFERRAP